MMMLNSLLCSSFYVVLIIMVLVGVAFFTLLERSVLGYMQIRKGPNKVGFIGVFQPFADAIKLFTKGKLYLEGSNSGLYYISPGIMMMVMMVSWLIFPFHYGGWDFKLGLLFFMCCSSLGVYTLFGCGWASNSKYALLGALRGSAQTISYEVSLSLILLSSMMLIMGLDWGMMMSYQEVVWFVVLMMPLMLMWFVSILAETNRTPFDFAEGESELVSGFNVEYSGGFFAILFMSEYGSMMLMSILMSVLYWGGLGFSLFFIVLFIWVRGSYPRLRYDKLMYLAWKSYLPVALNYMMFVMGVVMLCLWFYKE